MQDKVFQVFGMIYFFDSFKDKIVSGQGRHEGVEVVKPNLMRFSDERKFTKSYTVNPLIQAGGFYLQNSLGPQASIGGQASIRREASINIFSI